jgi:hypothetical protein
MVGTIRLALFVSETRRMGVSKIVWLSSRAMTICVSVREDGLIHMAPPIARKFIGQDLTRLVSWMSKQGDLRQEVLRGRDGKEEEVDS